MAGTLSSSSVGGVSPESEPSVHVRFLPFPSLSSPHSQNPKAAEPNESQSSFNGIRVPRRIPGWSQREGSVSPQPPSRDQGGGGVREQQRGGRWRRESVRDCEQRNRMEAGAQTPSPRSRGTSRSDCGREGKSESCRVFCLGQVSVATRGHALPTKELF